MYRRGETSPVLNTEAKKGIDVHSLPFMKTGEYSFVGSLINAEMESAMEKAVPLPSERVQLTTFVIAM